MASLREIRQRKSSIQSTQQITKAMKLVSTVKLQKASVHAEAASPYFHAMYETVTTMAARSGSPDHPYFKAGDSMKKAVVVITSNRGLAGGYNANVVKLVIGSGLPREHVKVYAIGRKGRESLERKGYEIARDCSDMMDSLEYAEAAAVCKEILEEYVSGEIGGLYLAYTHFKNTVTHVPTLMKLLPVKMEMNRIASLTLMNYEPNAEEVLSKIIPMYVASLFYGALVEAEASEHGARMQAMDSAAANAEEMISDLALKYNRARQSSITRELTEIIAGTEAISE